MRPSRPRARLDSLILEQVETEWVAYDRDRHRAYRLGPVSAFVLRASDGRCDLAAMTSKASRDLGRPVAEAEVRHAASRLQAAGLLEGAPPAMSRRAVSKRIAAAVLVAGVAVPTAAEAHATGCVLCTKCFGKADGTCCDTSGTHCHCIGGSCLKVSDGTLCAGGCT